MELQKYLFSFALLAVACASVELSAQTAISGGLTGIVTDPSGAVLQNARVEITDKSKGIVRSTDTDREGAYRFLFLAPERYSVTVTRPGFAAASQTVIIQVGQTASADFTLSLGSAKTAIDVRADAILLQTDKADLATVFSGTQVEDLPNPGNDLTAVVQTAPGAVMNTQQKPGTGGSGNFSTYGLPATSNLFTLDGMDENDPVYNVNTMGATGLTLGLNEVQEATVINNGYSGQYGRLAGANVNYVTKSGANQFHGNALYWWSGRILDANDWFNKFVPPGTPVTPRPFENANQYAASAGGPIQKNKSFFFIDYEGLRLVLPINFGTLTLIPSPEFETATLANLATTGHNASIPFYNQMFSLWNNAPGAERAVPGIPQTGDLTGCNGWPGPGTPGWNSTTPCAMSFRSTETNFTHEYLLGGRVDFNLGEKDKLFFRIRENQGLQAAYTDKVSPLFNVQVNEPIYQGQISETHIISSRAVNLFVFSARYVSAVSQQPNRAEALAAFPATLYLGDGTFTALGGWNTYVPFGESFTSYQILDDFTFSRGTHNLKFGMNFNRTDISDHNDPGVTGAATVFTVADFFAGGNGPSGDSLGQSFAKTQVRAFALYGLGFYGQDDWRIKRNFNLTFSLRVDHNSNPVCPQNCFARLSEPFDELNHNVSIPYNQAIATGLHRAWRHLTGLVWQPRFGFVWTPLGFKNTVVSGGAGLFMDTLPGAVATVLALNPPVFNSFTVFKDNIAPEEPSNLFLHARNSNSAFVSAFNNNGTVSDIETPPNITNTIATKVPHYQEWNFRVQQGLGINASLSVNYVGNHGIFIPISLSGLNTYCPPSACPRGFTGLPAAAPDPRFSAVSEVHSAGVSNYNGLVVSFQRRLAKGFQFQANYTWSHALDEVSNGGFFIFNGGQAGSVLNPEDSNNIRKYNYGNADYDTRHYFSASYVWELPYLRGPRTLLQGWRVAGTVFARSGLPYTVFDSGATNLLFQFNYGGNGFGVGSPVYANFLGSSYPGCNTPRRPCLDESEFSSPTDPTAPGPYTYGRQRRNQFYGPGFFDTDLALIKETRIRGWERARLGLRVLFFNLFNHPNFDAPNIDIGTPSTFGQITDTVSAPTSVLGAGLTGSTAPRLIQLTARITF